MSNAFYFTLKAIFVFKIFQFLARLWSCRKTLISKLVVSKPRKQTVAIHILPNLSRSKDNQTMKLGQLIEYNMRKMFLEKLYTKCGGETISRPFSKKLKFSISLNP